jgi:glycosyltransferase involved in cell wall biosynthesis
VLNQITPLLLTHNEAANIGRTLAELRWAKDIVIVDSFSSDETLEIVSGFPQARIFQRAFDTHMDQWSYALTETDIKSDWVLALDADYVLTPELIEELKALSPESATNGYRAKFRYCINGRPLRGSAYPPVTTLFRRANAHYIQDGHTQRIHVSGEVGELKSPIMHDDRKSLTQWIQAQSRYMRLEAEKLLQSEIRQLGWADRLRRTVVLAPLVMFFYCLVVKGAIVDGRIGLYYASQRMFSELLLSLYFIESDLKLRPERRINKNAHSARLKTNAQRTPQSPTQH